MSAVRAARRPCSSNHNISLKEWERDGWTYHAKGQCLALERHQISYCPFRNLAFSFSGFTASPHAFWVDELELTFNEP